MLNKFLPHVSAEPALFTFRSFLRRLESARLPLTPRTNYRFSWLAYGRSFDRRKRFGDSTCRDVKLSDPAETKVFDGLRQQFRQLGPKTPSLASGTIYSLEQGRI